MDLVPVPGSQQARLNLGRLNKCSSLLCPLEGQQRPYNCLPFSKHDLGTGPATCPSSPKFPSSSSYMIMVLRAQSSLPAPYSFQSLKSLNVGTDTFGHEEGNDYVHLLTDYTSPTPAEDGQLPILLH